jgi:hypothetical protein
MMNGSCGDRIGFSVAATRLYVGDSGVLAADAAREVLTPLRGSARGVLVLAAHGREVSSVATPWLSESRRDGRA